MIDRLFHRGLLGGGSGLQGASRRYDSHLKRDDVTTAQARPRFRVGPDGCSIS
jgi:hypothetical protein